MLSFSAAASTLNFPEAPLFISSSVAPNIMIMLDNSGSMQNIVPDVPFNAATVYLASCPSGRTLSTGGAVELHIANSSTAAPEISHDGTRYTFGTTSSGRCFDPNGFYGNVRLNPDTLSSGYYQPGDYLGTSYSGNFLNWYFGTVVGGRTWNTGQRQKPLSPTTTAQSRIQIVRTGASNLVDTLDSRLRVGLSAYNPNESSSVSGLYGGRIHEVIDALGAGGSAKRTNLKSKINALSAAGATPLASTLSDIGRYFARGYTGNLKLHPGQANESLVSVASTFNNHSIDDPSGLITANPIQFSCQRNFAVMLTDGRPQNDQVISSVFADYDGDCTAANGCSGAGSPNFDRKTSRTYESAGSDYLDDVAQALREIDLRPDFPNEINGSQFVNNIVSYLIGFADPAVQDDPLVKATADATHGGGGFFPATDSATLNDIFSKIGANILKTSGAFSSVALNSTRLETNSSIFQASFNSGDWSGDVLSYKVSTGAGGPCPAVAKGLLCTSVSWRASTLLNAQGFTGTAASDRKILTYNPGSRAGVPFRWASLTTAQQNALHANPDVTGFASDGNGSLRLDYLRGDRSKELASATPPLRTRSGVLGDVISSDPAFVGSPEFAYGFNNYASFRNSYANRMPMVYVGSNDGMLHGFDAATGKELLAYVPSKMYGSATAPKLSKLTQRLYTHQYGVDGAPVVGDAYLSGAWKSVLVGGLRTGGQGLYALNVTDPTLFAESKTDTVMWEFNDSDDPDLGYTFSKPSIVKMANGKWAAIVGNGYNNTEIDGNTSGNGKAALFIIFLDGPDLATGWGASGTRYIKLLTSAGSATSPNGLAAPAAVDINGDDVVDYIYAGDELGNLWRFNVNDATPSNWNVAYSNNPLFTAKNGTGVGAVTQPITERPEVGYNLLLPNSQSTTNPKLMIYFGTGRYLDSSDNTVAGQPNQSFYGIFDSFGTTTPSFNRSNLLAQTIIQEVSVTGGVCSNDVNSPCYRVTSQNNFTNTDGALDGAKGWYMDLINTGASIAGNLGERQITTPVLRSGKVIYTTLTPNSSPCQFGGGGFLMELDARNGKRLSSPTLDTNNDGFITAADNITVTNSGGLTSTYSVSGVRSAVGILATPSFLLINESVENKYLGGSTGNVGVVRESTNSRTGRISWRELSP